MVTFEASDGRHGITVNSFTSVSIESPLVLVSIARDTVSHDELAGKNFTVNVLGAEQEAVALHFAGKPNQEPRWVEGDVAPRLAGTLSWFACTPWAAYDGGDHTLYVGEVQDYDYRSGDTLGFVNGRFTEIPEFMPGHESLLSKVSPRGIRRGLSTQTNSLRVPKGATRIRSRSLPMGARTGTQFLDKWNAMRPHITIGGEVVSENVTEHPAFKNVAQTSAQLFDLQHDPKYKDALTYPSPTTGDPVNVSFLIPKTVEDLERRRGGMQVWAEYSHGFLGRSGDYMNSSLTALASAKK